MSGRRGFKIHAPGQNSIGFSDGATRENAGCARPELWNAVRLHFKMPVKAMQLTTSTQQTELECKLENGKRIRITKTFFRTRDAPSRSTSLDIVSFNETFRRSSRRSPIM